MSSVSLFYHFMAGGGRGEGEEKTRKIAQVNGRKQWSNSSSSSSSCCNNSSSSSSNSSYSSSSSYCCSKVNISRNLDTSLEESMKINGKNVQYSSSYENYNHNLYQFLLFTS